MTLVKKITLAVAATAAMSLSAIASAPNTIVDVAAGNKDFSTLVSLAQKAGLVDVLKSKGPFTVFAPTNEAFTKLPKATLEAVASDDELLKKVLLYHVVPGKVTAKDVVNVTSADTALKGAKVKVTVRDGKVYINDSKVVKTDIEASNGVIHVIDTVLVPELGTTAGTAKAKSGSCSGD